MSRVATNTNAHPKPYSIVMTERAAGLSIRHTTPPSGDQKRNRSSSATDENSTYVLLDRKRHNAHPCPLEPLPGHHAMLNRKKPKQADIDQQCAKHGSVYRPIDRLRYRHVADEPDRVQKGDKEHEVAQYPVGDSSDSLQY